MRHTIKPLKGIDSIEFGMTPEQVRGLLGAEFKSFKRTPTAGFPSDYFPALGVFAYYDQSGALEAIELASPATPLLDGVNLLGIGFDDLKTTLRARDAELEVESDGAIAHAHGVGVYAPNAKHDPKANCESVIVFRIGYYK